MISNETAKIVVASALDSMLIELDRVRELLESVQRHLDWINEHPEGLDEEHAGLLAMCGDRPQEAVQVLVSMRAIAQTAVLANKGKLVSGSGVQGCCDVDGGGACDGEECCHE